MITVSLTLTLRHQYLNPRNALRVAYFEKVLRNIEVHRKGESERDENLEGERGRISCE